MLLRGRQTVWHGRLLAKPSHDLAVTLRRVPRCVLHEPVATVVEWFLS